MGVEPQPRGLEQRLGFGGLGDDETKLRPGGRPGRGAPRAALSPGTSQLVSRAATRRSLTE